MEIKYLHTGSLKALAILVNEYLEDGWELHKSVVVSFTTNDMPMYVQAVKKYSNNVSMKKDPVTRPPAPPPHRF